MNPKFPTLDRKLADQWFGEGDEDDKAAATRMVTLLRTEVGPRFSRLGTAASFPADGSAQRELHSLRGAIGSFGFADCAQHLLKLELGWATLADSDRDEEIKTAREAFFAGLDELFRRYPYLRQD